VKDLLAEAGLLVPNGDPREPVAGLQIIPGVRKSERDVWRLGRGMSVAGVVPDLEWPRLRVYPGFISRTDWARSVTVLVAQETRAGRP
jgi:hypothetical protein